MTKQLPVIPDKNRFLLQLQYFNKAQNLWLIGLCYHCVLSLHKLVKCVLEGRVYLGLKALIIFQNPVSSTMDSGCMSVMSMFQMLSVKTAVSSTEHEGPVRTKLSIRRCDVLRGEKN